MNTGWRHRARNIAAVLLGLLTATALPLTLTRGNRYVGGSRTLVGLWVAVATAALIWLLATDLVASRTPFEWRGFKKHRRPRLPDWVQRIPYYLNPSNDRMWCANRLIEYGHAVQNRIPHGKEPSAIALALAVSRNPMMPDHFREVAYWEQDVYTFLSVRAGECQALFRRGHIPHTYTGLRQYMDSRLEELKTIHGRLGG